jgi:hypothetical protein
MKKWVAALIIFCLIFPIFVSAADLLPTDVPIKIVYQGAIPITSALTAKSTSEKIVIIGKESEKEMLKISYPYQIEKTEIRIIKTRYDEKMQTMGYWIEASRGGREVQVNNPIWIIPHPYLVVVSDVVDTKANLETITLKEDSKAAVEGMLQKYVNGQPLGKATVGTKE